MHTVRVEGLEEFVKGLERMASEVGTQKADKLQEGALRTAQALKISAPKATGAFAGTIDYDIFGDVAEVGPSDSYYGGRPVGRAIEEGRSPGTPPPWYAISARYGVGVASAKRIAKVIGDRGTPATKFVQNTYDSLQTYYDKLGLDAATAIVNKY